MLAFLRVFGDIAISASEEETHCAALRRQPPSFLIGPLDSVAFVEK